MEPSSSVYTVGDLVLAKHDQYDLTNMFGMDSHVCRVTKVDMQFWYPSNGGLIGIMIEPLKLKLNPANYGPWFYWRFDRCDEFGKRTEIIAIPKEAHKR